MPPVPPPGSPNRNPDIVAKSLNREILSDTDLKSYKNKVVSSASWAILNS